MVTRGGGVQVSSRQVLRLRAEAVSVSSGPPSRLCSVDF